MNLPPLLLLFATHFASAAPVVTVERYWSGPTLEAQPWAFHLGDDPAWADRDFDDSDWELRQVTAPWPSGQDGFAWYRLEVRCPSDLEGRNVSLGVMRSTDVLEVFVDGQPVGAHGSPPPQTRLVPIVPRSYPIPPEAFEDGRLVIALRLWQRDRHPLIPLSRPAHLSGLFIGHTGTVAMVSRQELARSKLYRAPQLLVLGVLLAAGVTHLLFWLRKREELAYLFFGGWCLSHTARAVGEGLVQLGFVPAYTGLEPSLRALNVVSILLLGGFFVTMLQGWSRFTRVAMLVMGLGMLPSGTVQLAGTRELFFAMDAFGFAVIMALLVSAWRRGIPDVGATTVAGLLVFVVPIASATLAYGPGSNHPLGLANLAVNFGWLFPVGAMSVILANRQARDAAELSSTYAASRRFVPYAFLELLGRETIRHVERGDSTQRDMTVMFSDIRGFTTLSEKRTVEENFAFINAYLAEMEPCIHAHGGFINQYLGDGIMALYPTTADAAVSSAIAMQRAVRVFSEDHEPIEIGIGLNSGSVMLGTIGGAERLDAGVVSDTQNLAARVEGMTKMYGARVLITGHTVDRLEDPDAFSLREIDRVVAKGKSEAITLYEVLDADDFDRMTRKLASRYDEGLQAFRRGDLELALEAFESCSDDGAAALMVQRCKEWRDKGLPADWDGIVRLQVK